MASKPGAAALGLLGLLVLAVMFGSFFTVTAGERAIVFGFGQVQSVEAEGLHFKLPFVESARAVDCAPRRRVRRPPPAPATCRP